MSILFDDFFLTGTVCKVVGCRLVVVRRCRGRGLRCQPELHLEPGRRILCSGVNFTNILWAAFTLVDPESIKKYSWVISIFLRFQDLRT